MKKKSVSHTLSSIFYPLFLSSLAAAGPVEGAEQLLSGLNQMIIILIQFISNTILDISALDEFLFAKIIFFILIFLVVYVTIDKNDFFGGNKAINRIITAAISILTIRFIPDELIQMIFLQYSALGVAIGMIIPFILILFFLHQSNWGPLPRKVGWVLYGISYVAIFSYLHRDLTGVASYIYWAGILGIIIAFFYDRQIHAAFGDVQLKKARHGFESERYAKIQQNLQDVSNQLSSGNLPSNIQKILEKRKEHMEKELSKIMKSL